MARRPGYARNFTISPDATLGKPQANKALINISDEHYRRLKRSHFDGQQFGLSKNEDAKNFLRREIYALGLSYLANPPRWAVSELVAKIRVSQTTRMEALENVFHSLLMSVYEEDDPISRQERWLMARELEYARRHNVPPEFLCGFLYQSGGRKNLLKKLEAGYIEPAFRDSDA